MKNIHLLVYATLGLVILILAGGIFYIYQDNFKKINLLAQESEDKLALIRAESECRPISEISIKDVFSELEELSANESLANNPDVVLEKLSDKTKYCGTKGEIVKYMMSGLEESLESARGKAQEAAFKSMVASTVPAIILYGDGKAYINAPESGKLFCDGCEQSWPDFNNLEGATWTGCDFEINKKAGTFKYCATYNGINAVCTQAGCTF